MKDYNKENIPLAKTLRKNMTPWERKLWYDFLRDYPVRLQRQKAIGNYIADFYCKEQGWSSNLTVADMIQRSRPEKMSCAQKTWSL